MSRKIPKEEMEKPSATESDLYEKVEGFFADEKNCEKTGSTNSLPLSLEIFGGTIYPDVYGVTDSQSKDFQVYMAEGKLRFRGRDFDICKGQAITLQRFADYVYVFFPKSSWKKLDKSEKSDVRSECENLNLGLLIVGEETCREVVRPNTNPGLLEEENRSMVRDEIVQYFPDFVGPQENSAFFERYAKLADNIARKSCILVDKYLVEVFTKIMPVSKQSVKPWGYDSTFELYLNSKLENSEALLLLKPFGSEVFDTTSPVLLIQERFKGSILRKKSIRTKMAKHFDECLRRECVIDTSDSTFYDSTPEEVLKNIENNKFKGFSIFEQIEILGVEIENIKENVEQSLQRIVDFSNSLG